MSVHLKGMNLVDSGFTFKFVQVLLFYLNIDMSIIALIKNKYTELFDDQPLIIRSPGRVNMIGEHTDYNLGLVLPAAINKNIYMAAGARADQEIHLYALDINDSFKSNLHELKPSGKLWPDYVLGVAAELLKKEYSINGFNIVFAGDIPQGAGLSSSAALECATAFAMNLLFSLNLEKMQLAKIAQLAENNFVGVQCGLMDQFASTFGKTQAVIKLDCRNFEYEYIPFLATDIKIVLLDTRVTHSLATSAYNERREQCEKGVTLVSSQVQGIKSLRDVTQAMLVEHVEPHDELVFRRCSYILAEIKRVEDGADDLRNNNFEAFGKRMYASHNGLQHMYEVSCAELDCLVDLVRDDENVLGARMMGGGFGGCTINLVRADHVQPLIDRVSNAYFEQMGLELRAYVSEIASGTSVEIVTGEMLA